MNWKRAAVAAAIALSTATLTAYAQPGQEPPHMPGPGMMGPGMMGHGMMGHGMMGGWGMGRGMMGGMGMMGLGAIGRLDLTDVQRRQVQKIADDLRRQNWDLMGKMHDERSRMRDAMWGDKRDRVAILDTHKRMSDLRQQMFANMLDAADKAEALLTPPQREQLRRSVH